jgi:hypothetical protein
MIFTKADRERLERIDKNLLSIDHGLREAWKANWGKIAGISESQGKLLAALDKGVETTGDHIAADYNERTEFLEAQFAALAGKLDGIRDGLADEIAELRRGIKEELSITRNGFHAAIGNAFITFEHKVRRAKLRKKVLDKER